jgi:ribosome-binding protein aMBF1 (putative translation factor)
MTTTRKFKSEALQYAFDEFIGDDPERLASYEDEVIAIDVAKSLHALRTEAGLSQRELAKKVRTTASVICRLEDADYEGHSLSVLRRIAAALNSRVEIRFVPLKRASGHGAGVVAEKPESEESG